MNAIFEKQYHLPIIRILYFFILAYFVHIHGYFETFGNFLPAFWAPHGILSFVEKPFLTETSITIQLNFWKVFALFSAIGLFYKLMAPLCFLMGLFIVTYTHCFSYSFHLYMPEILCGLPLAFSRASCQLSLDALIFKEKVCSKKLNELALFNLKLIFCTIYFVGGLSKLTNSGLAWVTSENLQNYFFRSILVSSTTTVMVRDYSLIEFSVKNPLLCNFMAGLTLFAEIFCPLSLLRKPFFLLFVPLLMIMQVGAAFTLGVRFIPYILIYLVWLPDFFQLFRRDNLIPETSQ